MYKRGKKSPDNETAKRPKRTAVPIMQQQNFNNNKPKKHGKRYNFEIETHFFHLRPNIVVL